jgi:hypothetical protein
VWRATVPPDGVLACFGLDEHTNKVVVKPSCPDGDPPWGQSSADGQLKQSKRVGAGTAPTRSNGRVSPWAQRQATPLSRKLRTHLACCVAPERVSAGLDRHNGQAERRLSGGG